MGYHRCIYMLMFAFILMSRLLTRLLIRKECKWIVGGLLVMYLINSDLAPGTVAGTDLRTQDWPSFDLTLDVALPLTTVLPCTSKWLLLSHYRVMGLVGCYPTNPFRNVIMSQEWLIVWVDWVSDDCNYTAFVYIYGYIWFRFFVVLVYFGWVFVIVKCDIFRFNSMI